jgi:isopenicillin N synthase-like dioxygenase
LTAVFADALGLPAGFFDRFTAHSIDVLRMNNYALPAGQVDPAHVRGADAARRGLLGEASDGELTGMGEHTDYGIVTVLWADRVPGLQVLGADRVWHDVLPEPGALLVNVGDLTARWTNERWLSTLHRVKPPGGRRPDRTAPLGGVLPRRRPRRADRDDPDLPGTG